LEVKLRILEYDSLEYNKAFTLQEEIRQNVIIKEEDNTVILLEHPPTITTGHRVNRENIFISDAECTARGIEIVNTNRGGDVTFHGPGQLVIYPVISLKDLNLTISRYVDLLEETIIATLKKFDIAGTTIPDQRGVWVEDRKIASIGINVKRNVTIHGAALNVNTDLSYFDMINPCGLGKPVTSMHKELHRKINIKEVKDEWLMSFTALTGVPTFKGKV